MKTENVFLYVGAIGFVLIAGEIARSQGVALGIAPVVTAGVLGALTHQLANR